MQLAACIGTAATLSLVLFFALIALPFVEIPQSFAPLFKLFVFAGALGAATTWVAMEYFLFGYDGSPALKKAFWFAAMCLPPLGPAMYCFIVYSRATAPVSSQRETATGASA